MAKEVARLTVPAAPVGKPQQSTPAVELPREGDAIVAAAAAAAEIAEGISATKEPDRSEESRLRAELEAAESRRKEESEKFQAELVAAKAEASRLRDGRNRLDEENDYLRRLLKGGPQASSPSASFPVPPSVQTAAPIVWEGRIPKDPLAPRIKFTTAAGSAEAEAREAYLKAAGIVSTPHQIEVSRVG